MADDIIGPIIVAVVFAFIPWLNRIELRRFQPFQESDYYEIIYEFLANWQYSCFFFELALMAQWSGVYETTAAAFTFFAINHFLWEFQSKNLIILYGEYCRWGRFTFQRKGSWALAVGAQFLGSIAGLYTMMWFWSLGITGAHGSKASAALACPNVLKEVTVYGAAMSEAVLAGVYFLAIYYKVFDDTNYRFLYTAAVQTILFFLGRFRYGSD